MANTDAASKEKVGTIPTSVRVTPTCDRLWNSLAERKGLSKAKYLEVMIRERAQAEGLHITTEPVGG